MTQPYGDDASPGPGDPPPAGSAPGSPGARPAPPPGRPALPGRWSRLAPLTVAVLALLLAFGSTVVAWRALDQARDAKAIALAGRAPDVRPSGGSSSVPTTAAPEDTGAPSAPPATPADVPRSPGETPELNEQTVYEPEYEKQPLVLKAPSCGRSMYADLDEPRAKNDPAGADIRYTSGCGNAPAVFRLLDGVAGSEDARPGMTPKECAEKIRSALIPEDAPVPVRKGTTFCVTTNYSQARARGDQWRMVLINVVGLANDGAATVEISAWNIPD